MTSEKLSFTTEQAKGGRGAWFLGLFLFWGENLKRSLILLDRTKTKINFWLTRLMWLVVAAGWLIFIVWLIINRELWLANPWQLIFFWRRSDPLILIFLLSLWFDLFAVYRTSEAKYAQRKINYRLLGDDKKRAKRATKQYDVSAAYSGEARRIVEDAYLLARKLHDPEVTIIHLFRVILKQPEVQNLFVRLNVDAQKLVDMIDRRLAKSAETVEARTGGSAELSVALQEVLVLAFVDAFNRQQPSVDALNIISFGYEREPRLAEMLFELEVDGDKLRNTVAWFRVNRRLIAKYQSFHHLALLKPGSNMNRAYTAIATPTLDHFAHDLTIRAKYGALDLCIGRTKEIEEIFTALAGGHNGVLLVGPVGVGKRTIIGGLAQLMVEENVPSLFKDKRLVELDVSRLVSGAGAAQAEERLLTCLSEVSRSGNIILYINNIENLIGISAGSSESLDLSEVLSEAIGRHHIYCLASVDTKNYSRFVENKAIGETMTTIAIKEPELNEAIQMLESKVGILEAKYDIYIIYSALEQAVTLSTRYLHDKFLPLKAFDLLEKAALVAAKNAQANPDNSFCTKEEVATAIGELTGIPASKVTSSESQKLLRLEDEIHQRLVDQEEAVKAVSASLRRARAAIKDSKRPIASFLFLGPTGVGKTELAKTVSEVYFGDEDYLIRLDMSEYQSPDSIRKMIGDVDGTLGYLTEAVRKKPFALILLDEIEKAHPDILNLFLQLLDDGRLTDGQGRTISFTESIIIATSNIGAVYIQEQIKAQTPLAHIRQELVDNHLNKYLRPELINRFDGIIVFKPLSQADVLSITTLMLKKIKKRLIEQGFNLKADKDGAAILAQQGFDPKFGARPLRRLLQDKIEDVIATKILSGELKRRDTIVINNQANVEIIKAPEL